VAIAIVSGAIANKPFRGGETWVRLNWLLGLRKLGFQVFLVEQITPEKCVDATGEIVALAASENLRYFREVERLFGLVGTVGLISGMGEDFYGLNGYELFALAEAASVLFNISGNLSWQPLLSRVRRKVFVDIDPGYTQLWHTAGNAATNLAGHDWYLTIGQNIGASDCPIPTGDIRWRHTLPPVALDQWPVVEGAWKGFTTVASWRGAYGPIVFQNATLGQKVHEFRKFVELPQCSGQRYELALDIHPADDKDRRMLLDRGWTVVDPVEVAGDPMSYRSYIQAASAEFSVAQGVYVHTQSGWFSDRTAEFLASGKPALVQDTGLGAHFPSGEGLLTFSTLEEAREGAEQISGGYARHCRAARRLAETYFDSDRVLGQLLDEIGLSE
jgi:hypothetical protein